MLESFEVGVPFQEAEEMDVLSLVGIVQKFKEVIDRKRFVKGCSWVNGWQPEFRGSFRLGGGRHVFRCYTH